MKSSNMTRLSKLLIFLLFLSGKTRAQINDTTTGIPPKESSSWRYQMSKTREGWSPAQDAKDFQVFVKLINPKTNAANVQFYGNETMYWLNDVKEIELAVTGINPANADDFSYHIVQNDSLELVSWKEPNAYRTVNGTTYAYLGKFNTDQKIIRVEIYNKKQYANRSSLIFKSLYLPPARLHAAKLYDQDPYLYRPHEQHLIPRHKMRYFDSSSWKKQPIQIRWSDSLSHLEIQMEPNPQFGLYTVSLKRTLSGVTDTIHLSSAWVYSNYSRRPYYWINAALFGIPGQYEVLVTPSSPPAYWENPSAMTVSIPFEVTGHTTYTLQQLLLILIIFFGIALRIYLYLRRRHRKKLAETKHQEEIARLQLTSVRSQLNPHFLFNALTGIQSLINKNEITTANHYLTRFARITRHILNEANADMISLKEEVQMLHDYLQMEQMRFGFRYAIEIDPEIHADTLEIPSMLIQPFAENAVKHGVSAGARDAEIHIGIQQKGQDILMEIQDNGPGFDPEKNDTGKGLQLCRQRIELFNSFHKETPIRMAIQSDPTGTTISLTLQQWL